MAKIIVSFVCGAFICYLIILGIRPILPAMADESASDNTSDNSSSLLDLLPDFDKIYRAALTEPFIKAESKIKDPEIADYYHGLMDKTGLADSNRD